jgi:hypothetical protein
MFSRYGRLAQISLKQAYGFVQYHTVAEGQAAMDNLQGIEIRGRKIRKQASLAICLPIMLTLRRFGILSHAKEGWRWR